MNNEQITTFVTIWDDPTLSLLFIFGILIDSMMSHSVKPPRLHLSMSDHPSTVPPRGLGIKQREPRFEALQGASLDSCPPRLTPIYRPTCCCLYYLGCNFVLTASMPVLMAPGATAFTVIFLSRKSDSDAHLLCAWIRGACLGHQKEKRGKLIICKLAHKRLHCNLAARIQGTSRVSLYLQTDTAHRN